MNGQGCDLMFLLPGCKFDPLRRDATNPDPGLASRESKLRSGYLPPFPRFPLVLFTFSPVTDLHSLRFLLKASLRLKPEVRP